MAIKNVFQDTSALKEKIKNLSVADVQAMQSAIDADEVLLVDLREIQSVRISSAADRNEGVIAVEAHFLSLRIFRIYGDTFRSSFKPGDFGIQMEFHPKTLQAAL